VESLLGVSRNLAVLAILQKIAFVLSPLHLSSSPSLLMTMTVQTPIPVEEDTELGEG
jgi:hypothetical protein